LDNFNSKAKTIKIKEIHDPGMGKTGGDSTLAQLEKRPEQMHRALFIYTREVNFCL
jgi:hypothetical protein